MIRAIEASGYRSLRYVRQELGGFQVLVGPNGSGKSTFLDVVGFLRDLLEDGVTAAVSARTPNVYDLVWKDGSGFFELAVELEVDVPHPEFPTYAPTLRPCLTRYAVRVGMEDGQLGVLAEQLILFTGTERGDSVHPRTPPSLNRPDESILAELPRKDPALLLRKDEGGTVHFRSQREGTSLPFRIGRERLGLANLPEDEVRYPVATRVRRFLSEGIRTLSLSGESMRMPSSPGASRLLLPNGANLPWVVDELRRRDYDRLTRWIGHLRTVLPGLATVETRERPEDRHRYLWLTFESGLRAPSWTLSDGTLRLLALTLIAYAPAEDTVWTVEEPENGIHPAAVEAVYQSLSSAYGGQVLCATHSPVMVALAEPEELLVFSQSPDGATEVVRGDRHPLLRDWKAGTDLGTLFAAGVLG